MSISVDHQGKLLPLSVERDFGGVSIDIDLSIYEMEAVLRASYKLTDTYHVLLTDHRPDASVILRAWPKDAALPPRDLAGRLSEELLEQTVRLLLERKTANLRELIVAQAFAEGNLLDPSRESGDYEGDPLGIARVR